MAGILQQMNVSDIFTVDLVLNLLRGVLYLIAGFVTLRIIVFIVRRIIKGRVTDQVKMIITKSIMYVGFGLLLIIVLLELGINLTPVLGAAGIVGLAIGIASQTSLSNLISGLFLISEKPFAVGDVVRLGDRTGVVQSIDMLSVKIRTFDNLYVRIPNQTIANSELVNITRYPIRRMDFDISVAYKEDLDRVTAILKDVAKNSVNCLDEPEPLILFKKFGDSGIELLFAVWFVKTDFLLVKNEVFTAVKRRFDEEGIEIPFPHRTIYTGSATAGFPIRLADSTAGFDVSEHSPGGSAGK